MSVEPRTAQSIPTAVISDCGRYRYALARDTGLLGGEGTVLFVMLNPSTADASDDDPTIRRCIGFARDWGYERLAVGNLYAFRATDPERLRTVADPVGPLNSAWLSLIAGAATLTVAAWGAHPLAASRAEAVRPLFRDLHCLGLTKGGAPRHPLYVRAGRLPVPFPAARGGDDG